MTSNVYAPPETGLSPIDGDSWEVDLRRRLIRHETSIRSLGSLYLLGGTLTIGVTTLVVLWMLSRAELTLGALGLLSVLGGTCALQYWVGFGLRRLDVRVRSGAALMSVLGLFRFPVGTALSVYVLHLLFGNNGQEVFSPRYQKVIQLTPHVHVTTSRWLFAIVLLLLTALVAALALEFWL